ncbi:MAG TPA: MoaD/ThiS family protein [Candidatus Acidoferrum sp.]|nr:MoaD/ThiS family protein [Candidatus Acidoferrum sp.]
MATVTINFVGGWRTFLGVRTVTIEVSTLAEARDFVEKNYGPVYHQKLAFRGMQKKQSVWESSNIMLNGRSLKKAGEPIVQDGDRIDLIPIVAGG